MGDQQQSTAGDAIVRLNVGGKIMFVARSTLTKDAHSVLGRMFAADSTLPPATLLGDGSHFFDCDPRCFAVVLDHLRHGTVDIDPALVGRIRCVADSVGIASLVEACDAQLAARAPHPKDSAVERPCECCPRCGEILPSDGDKKQMLWDMRTLLDKEEHAFVAFWYRFQYERYRAMVYHECRGPLRLLRNHWFELCAVAIVSLCAVNSFRT